MPLPLGTVLRDAAQLDHDAGDLIQRRPEHVPDRIGDDFARPSTFGWMPSAWFSSGMPGDLVEQERHEHHALLAARSS